MFPEFSVFVCRVHLVTEPTENVCGSGEGNWPKSSESLQVLERPSRNSIGSCHVVN